MKLLLLLLLALGTGFFAGRWSAPRVDTVETPVVAEETGSPRSSPDSSLHLPKPPEVGKPLPSVPSNSAASQTPSTSSAASAERAREDAEDREIYDTPADSRRTEESRRNPPPSYTNLDPRFVETLESSRRRNLKSLIQGSRPLDRMTPTMRAMIGKFEGDILIDETTGRTWQMALETEGRFNGSNFEGKSFIQLSRNGRPFVTSTSDGQLKNFRSSGDSGASVLIQIGDQFYLDARYDGQSGSIFGNFYGKTSSGDYRYRGYAILTRR